MTDVSTRERILSAVIEMLNAGEDPERITVRQIADRAGVAVGAVNYHFQSRDNLLTLAVAQIMGDAASPWYQPFAHPATDPLAQIRHLLKETARIGMRFHKLAAVTVTHLLLNGDTSVPSLIIPLLREVGPGPKSEVELRLRAYQLIVPLQAALLRPQEFQRYIGVDLQNDSQRDALIDLFIDNLLREDHTR